MMRIAPLLKNYMPEIITIDGVVGWDVTAESVKSQLDKASGKAIEVQISSPGGSVFTGISVFNLIKNYSGEKSTRIIGLAASMGSYIALATDRVTVEENAVYMVHNASGLAWGDHREMRKSAKLLEGLSNLLGRKYEAKTGKTTDEITALMDDETWMFGQEIVDQGFADEVVESESKTEETKDEALAFAKLRIEDCNAKLNKENQKEDLERAAALFKVETITPKKTPKGAVKMTPEQIAALQKENEEMKAKLEKAEAVEPEPKKEEPKADPPEGVSALALTVLESTSYHPAVKAMASEVLRGTAEESVLKAVVATADMLAEDEKTKMAAKEQDELKDTPPNDEGDTGIDANGKATSVKGIYAMGANLKAQIDNKKGIKKEES